MPTAKKTEKISRTKVDQEKTIMALNKITGVKEGIRWFI